MANSKITSLTELTTKPADNDMLVIVDVSDSTMNATGTNKKVAADMFIRTNGTADTLSSYLNLNNNKIENVERFGIGGTVESPIGFRFVGTDGEIRIGDSGYIWAFRDSTDGFISHATPGSGFGIVVNGSGVAASNSSIYCSPTSKRVGIAGQSSPSYELDVNGQAHASSFPTSSDIRLKEDIKKLNLTTALKKKLNLINAYTFRWKDDYTAVDQFKRKDGRTKDLQVGFIAQEVQAAVPELVTTWRHSKAVIKENGEPAETNVIEDALAVDYTRFVPILWEAVKELYDENTDLKRRLNILEARL